jgi:hypothetical protein
VSGWCRWVLQVRDSALVRSYGYDANTIASLVQGSRRRHIWHLCCLVLPDPVRETVRTERPSCVHGYLLYARISICACCTARPVAATSMHHVTVASSYLKTCLCLYSSFSPCPLTLTYGIVVGGDRARVLRR